MEKHDGMTPDELYQLGQEYEWGLGREQDYGKALHLYQLASDQNHTEAMKCLSLMVEEGRGYDLVTRETLENLPQPLPSAGLLNLFVQHTSCALSINENADPDARSDITGFRKDIRQESRIVWSSFDDCEGRNHSKGNMLFLKVYGLAAAVMTRLQRKSKGQRKKSQKDSAGLFTADLSALTRKE